MELLKGIQKSLVFAALLCVLTIGAAAYTLTYQTVTGYTGLNVETSTDHPWTVQEDGSLKSGNSGTDSSASVLKVTVTGSGVLHFDYKVSSPLKTGDTNPNNLPTEDVPDSLLIRANAEITADSPAFRKFTANQDRFYGEIDWTPGSVTVDAAEGVETDIFFAFRKDGNATKGISDCAWLKNLSFTTDTSATLSVSYNAEYGAVSGGGKYSAGTAVTLTAVPKDGCQFYGWVDDAGTFLSDRPEYGVSVNNDMTIRAEFALEGAYEARRGSTFYTSLTEALAAKKKSDIFLLKDTTLTEDAEIPSGVTLYIPYEEHYTTDYKNGGISSDNKITATPFRLLTVNSGVTLTVNGTLRLGAEMGKMTLCYQGHNNGAYGGVVNEGTIAVNGTLDSWGLITGSGTVTAVGGTVYEPFIVCDFAGGNNLKNLYQADAAPFKRYAMQNIQCALLLDSGSTLYGRGCLYGDSNYNEVAIPIVASGGLFQLANGATITRTYDSERQVSAFPGIGRENWTVSGGMTFGALEMNVLGVQISTGKCGFPLPYNLSMTLKNGSYNIPNHLRVMPGAALTVGRKATLTVGGSLYVLDGLKQGSMSGVHYASTEQLKNSGFSACGELTVDGGKLAVSSGASFGGVVQSTGSGSISIAEGALLTNNVQDGGKGHYSDNTAIFEDFTARANIGGALQNLTAGEYHAVGNDAFTLPSYTVKYVTNGEDIIGNSGYEPAYTDETVTIDQPMTGAWAEGAATPSQYRITAVNKTCYNEADNSCTSVDHELNGDTLTFTVTTLKSAYTHLVQVRTGDGAAVTVKPDEKGTYTVAGVNDDVTIIVTSVLKGDANLDGYVAANDATAILRYLAELKVLDEYGLAAADANCDGFIAANDATRILRFSAALIPAL
mgnify:CR=1 FL=1